MRLQHTMLWLALALPVAVSCGDKDDTGPEQPEADTDTDTDADSDTDTDADTDADADSDTDADTDITDEDCGDEVDNDGDDLVDCDDPDCTTTCPEYCDDGIDNDADGLVDCLDPDCGSWCGDEDCHDGADNDSDGLIDCEDDECFDACIEDCEDEFDNDNDGFVDCEDDECLADAVCPNSYTMLLQTTLSQAYLTTAENYYTRYGYNAKATLYGQVTLYGYADDGYGTDFVCNGSLRAYCSSYTPYPSMSYYAGYTKGAGDYVFLLTPQTPYGLYWRGGSCPVSVLPSALLGFTHADYTVTRYDSGAGWYDQYTSKLGNYNDMGKRQMTRLQSPAQLNTITWSASYTYP
jgi:hypothetical protein